MKQLLPLILFCAAATGAFAAEPIAPSPSVVVDSHCYELRTYLTHPGRLEALHARFRNHTNALLEKHGMKLVGFWVPQDSAKGAQNTLVYVVEHASRAAADAAWEAFRNDPDWIEARRQSELDGPIVVKVEAVFLNPTDYSRLQ
jgi:hypothetical protein